MIFVWSSGVYIDSVTGMNSCVKLKSESMTAVAQTAVDGLNVQYGLVAADELNVKHFSPFASAKHKPRPCSHDFQLWTGRQRVSIAGWAEWAHIVQHGRVLRRVALFSQ
jgi:hypothetical protein